MNLSLRTLLALMSSFGVVLFAGPPFIEFLKKMAIGEKTDQSDSSELNELHSEKNGTPTMGGLLILASTLLSALIWTNLNLLVAVVLMGMAAFGLIGLVDDWQKIRGRGGEGLTPRQKLYCQIGISLLLGGVFYGTYLVRGMDFTLFAFPGTSLYVTMIPFLVLFGAMVVTGSSNAVNLTDGLDGLAAGASLPVLFALMGISYVSGRPELAASFSTSYVAGGEELMVLLAALVGGLLGFLWFNCYPAQIFMGDTGSLSIGATIGLTALVLHQPLLLVILAGVFVLETLSVILQVSSYKLWKKRIFLIAPLHHHYQFKGISENKITVRFWIVSSLLALFTLMSIVA